MSQPARKLNMTRKLDTYPHSFRASRTTEINIELINAMLEELVNIKPSFSVMVRRSLAFYSLYLSRMLNPETGLNATEDAMREFVKQEKARLFEAAGRKLN
jgi:hypothetical protein